MKPDQLTPESLRDLLLAFDLAPVGLLVSRNRSIQSFNQAFSRIFGYPAGVLENMSLVCLYPTQAEFENTGDRAQVEMRDSGVYADERIMKRMSGELFWCHVTGQALDKHDPFGAAVWVFEDISQQRPVTAKLTSREREIAQLLVQGKSSKETGRLLGIGHRTIEAHKARLMRKFGVNSSVELVAKLVGLG